MSNANEIVLGLAWLMSVLSPDTTLASLAPGGVHRALAPPGSAVPYVIVGLQSGGNDALTMNAVRMMSEPLYQIKAVGPASETQTIANAAAQIDVLLGGKDGIRNAAITGGYIAACYREAPLLVDSLVDGEQWTDIGGLWRIQVEQAS